MTDGPNQGELWQALAKIELLGQLPQQIASLDRRIADQSQHYATKVDVQKEVGGLNTHIERLYQMDRDQNAKILELERTVSEQLTTMRGDLNNGLGSIRKDFNETIAELSTVVAAQGGASRMTERMLFGLLGLALAAAGAFWGGG